MKKKMIFIPFFFVGLAALLGYVVMLLWNNLMPEVFDLGTITYWQAIGLFILAKLFFGGWHGKSKCCHGGHSHGHWKHKFKSKWHSMPEEDKQKWEKKFGKKCGYGFSESEDTDKSEA